jgi:hypothetical protein
MSFRAGTDTDLALGFRSPKVQGIIRAAFRTIDTFGMDRAIGMNRAAIACRAELLLFYRFLANGLVRRQDFVPILIVLFHRIYLALVLRAIWMPRLVAKTLRAIPRCEIEPTARHVCPPRAAACRQLCSPL